MILGDKNPLKMRSQGFWERHPVSYKQGTFDFQMCVRENTDAFVFLLEQQILLRITENC